MIVGSGPETHAIAFFEATNSGVLAQMSLLGQRNHGAMHSISSDSGQKPPRMKESRLRRLSQASNSFMQPAHQRLR